MRNQLFLKRALRNLTPEDVRKLASGRTAVDYSKLIPERIIGPVCPMEIYVDESGHEQRRPYHGNPFTGEKP